MKTIVAGSRSIADAEVVHDILDALDLKVSELVHGGALGVDRLADAWAVKNSIPVRKFFPDYAKYPSRTAPIMRNKQMASYVKKTCPNGGALVAIHDGSSRGTENMINEAKALGIKNITVIIWK